MPSRRQSLRQETSTSPLAKEHHFLDAASFSPMFQSVRTLTTSPRLSKRVGIAFQNPFKWLLIQAEFGKLRQEWDPTFDKKEFVEATKQVENSSVDDKWQ